jgi:hypothetical protein
MNVVKGVSGCGVFVAFGEASLLIAISGAGFGRACDDGLLLGLYPHNVAADKSV